MRGAMTDIDFAPYRTFLKPQRIGIILSNGVTDFRMTLLARHLMANGYDVEVMSEVGYWKISAIDVFIICRPGMGMVDFVANAISAGKVVIIDMDDDFYSIPTTNPAYPYVGQGAENGLYLKKLQRVIDSATLVTYASPILAERYNRNGFVIPNTWDDENDIWYQPKPKPNKVTMDMVTIGWAGTATHLEDFMTIYPAICKVLDENERVNILIGADVGIYNLFKKYPEHKKIFIPGQPYESYPFIPKSCDIWLAPLIDNHFNRAKSWIKLLDAGAAGIPYVASKIQQYEAWNPGPDAAGFLCDGVDDWFYAMTQLIHSHDLRKILGMVGHELAMEHSSTAYGIIWDAVIGSVLNQ
jgi:hypothetical protein